MTIARFLHDGQAIDYTPASDVVSGDVIVQGELLAIAKRDIPANTLGELATVGVFDIAKATGSGTAIAAGVKIYWDSTVKVATSTVGTNKYLGKSIRAATDSDATVRVRLEQ